MIEITSHTDSDAPDVKLVNLTGVREDRLKSVQTALQFVKQHGCLGPWGDEVLTAINTYFEPKT